MIYSFEPFGYEGSLVNVEADIRDGIPAVDIVGIADSAVKELRERTRVAIKNSGFEFPKKRVLLSLSPADLRKNSAVHDLSIALAVLCSAYKKEPIEKTLVLGEIRLDGTLRPCNFTYAAMQSALNNGITKAVLPDGSDNPPKGMKVVYAKNLKEAFHFLTECSDFDKILEDNKSEDSCGLVEFPKLYDGENLDDIFLPKCDDNTVNAIITAVAGRHNLLMFGAPGCGKTNAAMSMEKITPLLTYDEFQSVKRIHNLAGLFVKEKKFTPFRTPHCTATIEGICGGGVNCRPGEISLAHNGVLLLDEASEFKTSVLQTLRLPLETKRITLSRAGRSTVYPADFQLVMTTNPCPCGNLGSKNRICLCSSKSVEMFWKKFSAPLLNRIEISIRLDSHETDEAKSKMTIGQAREIVAIAVRRQRERGFMNGTASFLDIERRFDDVAENDAKSTLSSLSEKFSSIEILSIKRVALTLADIDGSDNILQKHIDRAVALHQMTPANI